MKKTIIILLFLSIILMSSGSLSHADQGDLFGIENLYNNLFITRNPFEPQLPKESKEIVETKTDVPDDLSVTDKLKDFLASRGTLINLAEIEKRLSQYDISGLVWESDRPQAIINRQVFDIGDMLDDLEIVAINKTGVDVKIQGHTLTISSK